MARALGLRRVHVEVRVPAHRYVVRLQAEDTRARHADAYTGWWYEDAKQEGVLITVGQSVATAGTFLLRCLRRASSDMS